MSEKKLNLQADFPSVSSQEWMDKVVADLKGADFDKKLLWKTNEGFTVRPFYRSEDIQHYKTIGNEPATFPFVRSTKLDNNWLVRQDLVVKDPLISNNKALDILNKGVNSLGFRIHKDDVSESLIHTLLEGINAECVELNFRTCSSKSLELIELLSVYFQHKQYDPLKLQGSVNFDPINSMIMGGKKFSKEDIALRLTSAIRISEKNMPLYRVVQINAQSLSNSGAFVAQELGYALAWGSEYLSLLTEQGVDTALAAKSIKFNFGVGSNYFIEIAKFRAARWLWSYIVDAFTAANSSGVGTPTNSTLDAMKMHIHAETTEFNKTVFDTYVNLLRTQTEAMSATLGGVDSLTVLPFDSVSNKSDEFSERIARNQQLLLKEESNFDKIIDPSAGSYYIETLTNEIAQQAWNIFLNVDELGGFWQSVTEGVVQERIHQTAKKRLNDVSSRREILLGTNQFPNFNEISDIRNRNITADCGCVHTDIPALNKQRAAQEFEALRFATESAPKRPKVFMLTIGNLAMRLARAQFSCNFFACAGYEVVDNIGFATIEEGVQAARNVEADLIVLCSSDDEYSVFAPDAYELTKHKEILVIAGAPACADQLKQIGIEHFINVKSNVLQTLKAFNALLNIA